MNIKNILCAVDLSSLSDTANAHASALAKRYGATVHYVYVYEPVFADGYIDGAMSPPPIDVKALRERLEQLKPTCDEVQVQHELMVGFAAASLVSYANTHEIDLIVISTHGRTGASRFLLGSVAESVARAATCPVLTVHEGHASALTETAD